LLIKNYTQIDDIKFYTRVTQSHISKSRTFHYITFKIDKTAFAFSHGNLEAETLSKIVLTIQDGANTVTVNMNIFRVEKNPQSVFRHPSLLLSNRL